MTKAKSDFITVKKHLNIINKNSKHYTAKLAELYEDNNLAQRNLEESQNQLKKQQEIWREEERNYGNRISNLRRQNEVLELQMSNLEKTIEVLGGVLRNGEIDYEKLRRSFNESHSNIYSTMEFKGAPFKLDPYLSQTYEESSRNRR